MSTADILQRAADARIKAALLDTQTKRRALLAMADAITEDAEEILSRNALDMKDSEGKLSEVMTDRLLLNRERILAMASALRETSRLEDPVGRILEERIAAEGILLRKISVPIGVIAIIYESRPNVTSDAAALCLMSGNVAVLRSGSEAYRTSMAITISMRRALEKTGLDPDMINITDDPSRKSAEELMTAVGKVDLLIPRGGAGLIRSCVENAKVPVIETGTGICHVYVDASADQDMALRIIDNAKTQRPSVCNAEEVCLVSEKIAEDFLPRLKKMLVDDRKEAGKIPVELRLDEKASRIIEGKSAEEEDFDTEFLDYILAVKVVRDVREAIEHIEKHSTHHSDAIIAEDTEVQNIFTSSVDSACVYVNASTRFTDGGMFGMGCEMGISTQRLHARGPMGLREMNTYKYVITGNGQIRR